MTWTHGRCVRPRRLMPGAQGLAGTEIGSLRLKPLIGWSQGQGTPQVGGGTMGPRPETSKCVGRCGIEAGQYWLPRGDLIVQTHGDDGPGLGRALMNVACCAWPIAARGERYPTADAYASKSRRTTPRRRARTNCGRSAQPTITWRSPGFGNLTAKTRSSSERGQTGNASSQRRRRFVHLLVGRTCGSSHVVGPDRRLIVAGSCNA